VRSEIRRIAPHFRRCFIVTSMTNGRDVVRGWRGRRHTEILGWPMQSCQRNKSQMQELDSGIQSVSRLKQISDHCLIAAMMTNASAYINENYRGLSPSSGLNGILTGWIEYIGPVNNGRGQLDYAYTQQQVRMGHGRRCHSTASRDQLLLSGHSTPSPPHVCRICCTDRNSL